MFVRVCELGSMSAAARDQRTSPAVASARNADLDKHLGVRRFNRTTRSLQPTEHGRFFHDGAQKVLDAIEAAETAVEEGRYAQSPAKVRGISRISRPRSLTFLSPQSAIVVSSSL
jgi:DNA-binding transcriptional LysR family regulator